MLIFKSNGIDIRPLFVLFVFLALWLGCSLKVIENLSIADFEQKC